MTPWSTLYPYVEPLVIGAPIALIDQQLFIVAREFSRKTLANRKRLNLPYRAGTGSIAEGSDQLTLVGLDVAAGDPVVIKDAGGVRGNLCARVLAVTGAVATLDSRAARSVTAAAVSAPSYEIELEPGEKLVEVAGVSRRSDGIELQCVAEDLLNDRRPGWRFEMEPEPLVWTMDFYRRLWLYRAPDRPGEGLDADLVLTVEQGAHGIPDALADEWGHVIAAGAAARLLMMKASPWGNADMGSLQQTLYTDGVSEARSVARRGHVRTVRVAAPQSFAGL